MPKNNIKLYNIYHGEGWTISYDNIRWLNRFGLYETSSIVNVLVSTRFLMNDEP